VLIAIGREPFTENLSLDAAGINLNQKGCIDVNRFRQTMVDHIYAIGDIVDGPHVVHKAQHEGINVVEHIAGDFTVLNE
jgi:dihydrolipoamide dehydrogenase